MDKESSGRIASDTSSGEPSNERQAQHATETDQSEDTKVDYFSDEFIPQTLREIRRKVEEMTGKRPMLSTRGEPQEHYSDLFYNGRSIKMSSSFPGKILTGAQDDNEKGITEGEAVSYLVDHLANKNN